MKNKKEQKKTNKKEELTSKEKKKYLIAATSIAAVMICISVFALVSPLVRINSEFHGVFESALEMEKPMIVITDMSVDNVFSPEVGEVMINDPDKTAELIERFVGASEKVRYKGKNKTAFSSWDIRVMVREGEQSAVFYLSEDVMYYSVGTVKYHFKPKNDDARNEYRALYEDVKKLINTGEQAGEINGT